MRANRVRRAMVLLASTALFGLGIGASASAQDASATVISLDLDGVVDPFVASYIEDGIAEANELGAAAVILQIDTPGGLDSAMRRITQAVLNSEVPVICWTGPSGARAASAGAFIMMACPAAAMAPGTNMGAAHPVGISGAIASEKAENDSASYMRALAERNDRDADWAESAVRESASASAEEALDLGVIDVIASDPASVLQALDGREIMVAGGAEVTLRATGLVLVPRQMGAGVSLLHAVLDPNLAFIFFYLGIAFVVLEFFVPGGILGVVGGLMLVLAVIALGMLPVQLLGVVLLIASVAAFVLEINSPGVGVPTAVGVITLVLGGMLLFDRSVPGVGVSPWVIAPVAIFATGFFTLVIRAALKSRRQVAVSSTDRLLQATGVVVSTLEPQGVVQVAGEHWTADSVSGPIPRGSRVRVVGMQGLRLRVEPEEVAVEAETAAMPAATSEGGTA